MKIKDNMHISDKQLDAYFNTIKECVDAVKGHQQSLKADEIKDRVKQVTISAAYFDGSRKWHFHCPCQVYYVQKPTICYF